MRNCTKRYVYLLIFISMNNYIFNYILINQIIDEPKNSMKTETNSIKDEIETLKKNVKYLFIYL